MQFNSLQLVNDISSIRLQMEQFSGLN